MSLLDEVDSQCQPAKASTNNQDVDFEIRGVLNNSHCNDEFKLLQEWDFIRDIESIHFRNGQQESRKLGMLRDRGPMAFNFPTGFRAVSRKANHTLMHDTASHWNCSVFVDSVLCGVSVNEVRNAIHARNSRNGKFFSDPHARPDDGTIPVRNPNAGNR